MDDAYVRARRGAEELVLRALDGVLSVCLGPDAPLHLTIDETLVIRSGSRMFLIVVGVPVRLPFREARPVSLPLLVRLCRTNGRERSGGPSRSQLVRSLVYLIADRHPRRRLHVVAKESYTSSALRGLPGNATVTVEMPDSAVIQGRPPPRTGRRGRPRRKGDPLGRLSDLGAAGGFAETATPAGTCEVKRIEGQWYSMFGAQPVQIVLARSPASPRAFDVALASTDLDATPADLLARYCSTRAGATCWEFDEMATSAGDVTPRILAVVARCLPLAHARRGRRDPRS